MSKKQSSLFDQALDRSVFVTYFLGGVVPLCGFAFLSERLMPTLDEQNAQWGLVGLVVTVGILSLSSFFALRRIVRDAVTQMEGQNERLESLLDVARELAEAPHAHEVTESTTRWSQRLCGADASWILGREDWDKSFEVLSQRGDQASDWFEAHQEEWTGLIDRSTGESETIQIAGDTTGNLSVVLTPLRGGSEPANFLLVARTSGAFETAESDSLRTLAAQAGVALANVELGDAQRNFFSHMTDLVVAALDTHIQYRSGHASNVAKIANRVGRSMGLDDADLHDLHFAALLHDVGMLKIPAAHQRDPKFFRKHSTVGYKMLSRIKVWQKAAPIVLQHHERPDGTGYPDGMMGDDICIGARILAVCDAWDAMRSEDSDRASIPLEEALGELASNVGTQFDPDVVSTFEALAREGVL
jgi:putative nucleotidyltransferase with HDIG domain